MPVVTEKPEETPHMPEMTQTIELVLKSPTDRIAPFSLVCQPSWTVRQLKLHISDIYPGKPSANSQKVIYAGKLLVDEQNIIDIFQPNSSTVVHLICQSAANTDKDTPVDTKQTEMSAEQFPDLYKQYQEYLQNFYTSGSQPAAMTATTMSQYQQMMWMNQAAYAHSCAQFMAAAAAQCTQQSNDVAAQCKQQSSDVAAANAAANTGAVPTAPVEEPEVRQRLGREERAPRVNAGAVAVQNMMAAAFEGGDEAGADGGEAGEGEPRDALHYLYVLVRFGLLLLICYYYSSLASVLTTLVLFSLFFGVNLLRRNNQQQQEQPPAVVVNETQGPPAASVDSVVNDDGSGHPVPNETDGPNSSPRNADPEQVASPTRAVMQPTTSISQRLRQAACTSLQFVMAFFVTLFPEPIAHIDLQ